MKYSYIVKLLIPVIAIFFTVDAYSSSERYLYDQNMRLRSVARSIDVHHRYEYDDLTNLTKKSVLNDPDSDLDGLTDTEEATLGLDANNSDQDADGIIDGAEYFIYQSDPQVDDAGQHIAGTEISTLYYKAALSSSFSANLTAMSGQAPFSWSITTGSLPPGLALDPSTGQITGIPTTLGEYTATYTITDSLSAVFTGSVTIEILLDYTQFESQLVKAADTDGVVNLVVRRTYAGDVATIDYAFTDDTAAAGVDYNDMGGTLVFAKNEYVKIIRVQLLDNPSAAADRQFYVILSNPVSTSIGNTFISTVLLTYLNPNPGTIEFSSVEYRVNEDAGYAAIELSRRSGALGEVTVRVSSVDNYIESSSIAQPDVDYTRLDQVVTFLEGEKNKTVPLSIVHDYEYPEEEYIDLLLSDPTNGATLGAVNASALYIDDIYFEGTGFGVIAFSEENPIPWTEAVNIYGGDASGVPENAGSFQIAINRLDGSTGRVTVDYTTFCLICSWGLDPDDWGGYYATPGSDYVETTGTLVFEDGETKKYITVQLIDDQAYEWREEMSIKLYNPTGGSILASSGGNNGYLRNFYILDAEIGKPEFANSMYNVDESSGSAVIEVKRIDGVTGDLLVNYATADNTALANQDYLPVSGTLTFVNDQNAAYINVPIIGDSVDEPEEFLTLTLTDVGNGNVLSTTELHITEPPRTPPAVSDGTYSITEDEVNGALVGNIIVTSAVPLGDTLTYSITAGDPLNVFSVNTDGQIILNDSSLLDLASNPVYTINITVTNSGGLSVSAVYTINIVESSTITLVSKSINGASTANDRTSLPHITKDGRYVVFLSSATDLVNNDTNGMVDLFRKDMATGEIELVSVDATGAASANDNSYLSRDTYMYSGAQSYLNHRPEAPINFMSDDSRFIGFISDADNLVANDNNGLPDLFLRDMQTGITQVVSVDSNGNPVGVPVENLVNPSENTGTTIQGSVFHVSHDGKYVIFQSEANNIMEDDQNNRWDYFIRDMSNGTTKYLWPAGAGSIQYISIGTTGISDNGQYLLKDEWAPAGVAWDPAGPIAYSASSVAVVVLYDVINDTKELVSISTDNITPPDANSRYPRMTGDARYVAFYSLATNIVPDADLSDPEFDTFTGLVYFKDLVTGITKLVTKDNVRVGDISEHGKYLLLSSDDQDLTSKNLNGETNFFVYDNTNSSISLVSETTNGTGVDACDGLSCLLSAYVSEVSDLVIIEAYSNSNLTNDVDYPQAWDSGYSTLYGRDLKGNRNFVIAKDVDNKMTLTNDYKPTPDNQYIAFLSGYDQSGWANLTSEADTNGLLDIFFWSKDGAVPVIPDSISPVITTPSDITVEASAELSVVILPAVYAVDDVDGDIEAVASDTGPFALGSHTITWTATDTAGNTSTVDQILLVQDTTPPQLTAPSDRVYEANVSPMSVDLGLPTFSDAVDPSVVVTADNLGPFELGVHVITWTAQDAQGNLSNAIQQIVVQDTIRPTLSVPADIYRGVSSNDPVGINLQSPVVFDWFPVTITSDAPALFPIGTTIVTWSAVDSNGNSVSKQQNVTLYVDNLAPIVTPPADINIATSEAVVSVDLGIATAVDDIDGQLTPFSNISSPFLPGNYQVVWSATDNAGNTGKAIQNVNITSTIVDTDNDGISDDWEIARYGNLNQDLSTDIDGNGVIDIQDYMNEINGVISTQVAHVELNKNDELQFNLFDYVTEPNGEALTLSSTTTPSHGEVVIFFNGEVVYIPETNYYGEDFFRYVVSNSSGNSSIGFVYITVLYVDTDTDGDGVLDSADAFPLDPNESVDTDGDGIGNNADPDDDNDGMPDSFENLYGLNPLNPVDASSNIDGDDDAALAEYHAGTDPTDINSNSTGIPYVHYKLLANDGVAGNLLGLDVAIDGNRALVVARDSNNKGVVYVYISDGAGNWYQQAKLLAEDAADNDSFGSDVALSGTTALIGAFQDDDGGVDSGSAYIFTDDGTGNWIQQTKLTASDAQAGDRFGNSVALSGSTAFIGAIYDDDGGVDSGSVYIFTNDGAGSWSQQSKLIASDTAAGDYFGYSLALSEDAAVIAAISNDSAGLNAGSAYIFTDNGSGIWSQQAKLTAADAADYDAFGSSVAISGSNVLIGAYGNDDAGESSGSAYLFADNGAGIWSQHAKLTATDADVNDLFGFSVSLSDSAALIGAWMDDDEGYNSGAAYIFTDNGLGVWSQQAKLTARDGAATDFFGYRVSISGTTVVTGSRFDDDAGAESGSAYIFELDNDGDGFLNSLDAFPSDPSESVDTDDDGIGNNADLDDDNDGIDDVLDAFPLDLNESVDTDGDGVGNNADLDDDNDGVDDDQDAFPLDPTRTYLEGDINGDQAINVTDLFMAKRYLTGDLELTPDQVVRGDIYPPGGGDGDITISDVLLLKKSIMGQ